MTKREAKIHALRAIGSSLMVLTADLETENFSGKDTQKIVNQIDAICLDMLDRADNLSKNKVKDEKKRIIESIQKLKEFAKNHRND